MAAVCGGGGRSCVGGGGGSGDGGGDDGGATEAAAGTALQQTSRVVAATRLDFYSAFALGHGQRLECGWSRTPIAEYGAAAEAAASGSR